MEGDLVSFEIVVIKYPDKNHVGDRGLILAYSPRGTSLAGQRGSMMAEEAGRAHCMRGHLHSTEALGSFLKTEMRSLNLSVTPDPNNF